MNNEMKDTMASHIHLYKPLKEEHFGGELTGKKINKRWTEELATNVVKAFWNVAAISIFIFFKEGLLIFI